MNCMHLLSEYTADYPGRPIWQALRKAIGGPNAIELPAPPLPGADGMEPRGQREGEDEERAAREEEGGEELDQSREPTAGETQLYLEIRQAVVVLQSPALTHALENKDLDAACSARHSSAVQHALDGRPQRQRQRQSVLLGNLGTIEGGVLLTDIPAIVPSKADRLRHPPAATATLKIPRIGLGLGCPRISEGRYSMMGYVNIG